MVVVQLGIKLCFEGMGVEEKGIVVFVIGYDVSGVKLGDVIIVVDLCYFCLVEVEMLFGDLIKVYEKLGWKLEIIFREMVFEMVVNDFEVVKKYFLLKFYGYDVAIVLEL